MKNNLLKLLVAATLFVGVSSTSHALVYDESTLGSFTEPGNYLYVDWMVLSPDEWNGGGYLYMYQLEAPESAGTLPEHFTIKFDTSGVTEYGVIHGDNLDVANANHPAHTVVGESDPYTQAQDMTINSTINPDNISWDIVGGLPLGYQTETLYFIDVRPPTFGNAFALDGNAWGSQGPGGEQVPVPGAVPDAATTIIMLGAAVMGLGLVGRKLA